MNLLNSSNRLGGTREIHHPVINKINFSFRKFVSACKKSAHFIE